MLSETIDYDDEKLAPFRLFAPNKFTGINFKLFYKLETRYIYSFITRRTNGKEKKLASKKDI